MALSMNDAMGVAVRNTMCSSRGVLSVPCRPLHYARPRRNGVNFQVFADAKMHVPADSFGGRSPEVYFADRMNSFFTFVAVRVVISQLEGMGRGNLAAYNAENIALLHEMLEKQPLKDGDEWLAQLMRRNKMLGLRIAEVRAAYGEDDFEWESLRRQAVKSVKDGNLKIMRASAAEAFARDAVPAPEAE